MTAFTEGLICERWPLVMPDFRVGFHAERPKWEIGRLEHMAERVGPGMVVWDVGAEHGDFTALYRSWGAEVVPIEPSPGYWPCIRQTYEANGFGPPPAWFAGFLAHSTQRRALDLGCDTWPAVADGEVVADYGFRHLAHDSTTARISADDLSEIAPRPDVVTIDVEGAEWHVLYGSRRMLQASPVLVYVSVHEPTMGTWYRQSLGDLRALMGTLGYEGEELPAHGEAETFWVWRP